MEAGRPISAADAAPPPRSGSGTQTLPSPLQLAVWGGDLVHVRALLESARPAHAHAHAHAHARAAHGGVAPPCAALAALLSEGGPAGELPLALALRLGHTGIARALLEAGASATARDADEWRVWHRGLPFLRSDPGTVLRVLERAGADEEADLFARLAALQRALAALPDFTATLSLTWASWVPLLARAMPFDTFSVTKVGSALRLDGSLLGLRGGHGHGLHLPTWARGRLSLLLTAPEEEGDAREHGRLWAIDRVGARAADLTLSDAAERRMKRLHHLGQISAAAAARPHASRHRTVGAVRAARGGGPSGSWWWMCPPSHSAPGGEELETEFDLEHAALHLVSAGVPNVDAWCASTPTLTPVIRRTTSRLAAIARAPASLLRSVLGRSARPATPTEGGGGGLPPGHVHATTSVGAFPSCTLYDLRGVSVHVQARPALAKGAVGEWEKAHGGEGTLSSASRSAVPHLPGRALGRLPGRRASRTMAEMLSGWFSPDRGAGAGGVEGFGAAAAGVVAQAAVPVPPPAPAASPPPSPASSEGAGELTLLLRHGQAEEVTVPLRTGDTLTWSVAVDGGAADLWATWCPGGHYVAGRQPGTPPGSAMHLPSWPAELAHELVGPTPIRPVAHVSADTGAFSAPLPGTLVLHLSNPSGGLPGSTRRVWVGLDKEHGPRTGGVFSAQQEAGEWSGEGGGGGREEEERPSPPSSPPEQHAAEVAEDAAVEAERTSLMDLLAHVSGTSMRGGSTRRTGVRVVHAGGGRGRLSSHPLASAILDGCGLESRPFEAYFKVSPEIVRAAYGLTEAELPTGAAAVFIIPPPSTHLQRTLHASIAAAPYGTERGCVPLALSACLPLLTCLAPDPATAASLHAFVTSTLPPDRTPVSITVPVMPALGLAVTLSLSSLTLLPPGEAQEAVRHGELAVPPHFMDATEEFVTESFFSRAGTTQ